jgi:hypothetical protein
VGRALHMGLISLFALVLVACESTVAGKAVLARDATEPDGAVIARMNTGPYSTTPSHPYGSAGDDVGMQGTLEGHRLAPFVTGPWQVNATLVEQPPPEDLWTGPLPSLEILQNSQILPDPMVAIAAAHGFFVGFNSVRVSHDGGHHGLQNVVLEFSDPGAAAAAATELAALNLPSGGQAPGVPVAIPYHPEAHAMSYVDAAGATTLQAIVARGPFVFISGAHTDISYPIAADVLVQGVVDDQERAIAGFVPTEPAKRAALPMDPTGALLVKTLWAPDNAAPFIIGVWDPQGWLHFEDDPVKSAALFTSAGVEVVSQRLTTVYQTHNADGAGQVVDAYAKQMANTTDVEPAAGVPGLPAAKCFVRTRGAEPATSAVSFRRVYWRYKCVARADKYAFTAFSNDDADVHQQMSAQYRLLVGK